MHQIIRTRITDEDLQEMELIVDKLKQALSKHRKWPVIMVVARLLPELWSSLKDFETTTEALDTWRILNAEMEEWIKQHSGRLH